MNNKDWFKLIITVLFIIIVDLKIISSLENLGYPRWSNQQIINFVDSVFNFSILKFLSALGWIILDLVIAIGISHIILIGVPKVATKLMWPNKNETGNQEN